MAKKKKITFIGPGVMAEAMISRIIESNIAQPDQIIAAGPRPGRGKQLENDYGIHYESDNGLAAQNASILIISVKPQQLTSAFSSINGKLPKDCLLLSIVAGASIQRISELAGHTQIVRAMPNTPAQIGKGITVWTASEKCSDGQKKEAEEILSALGIAVFVDEENYLDKATALSGTGPAYAFLFMEAMVDAGVHLGFPRRLAEQLVVETLRGSVEFYDQSEEAPRHLARLRNQVTSPGGTSAEALYYLEKAGFRTAISRAIWAAYERSRRLGGPDSNLRNTPEE
jgi:pyrroline-5-carboxylate reductase